MTITRTITVAAGVFAPGHLGELTRIVPFELADAVLAEAGAVQRRVRRLPSRVGLYFVLAMCLFPEAGYGGVWAELTRGLGKAAPARPDGKALRDLRRRIGTGPVKALFEVLAGPAPWPRLPGVRFGRYRTVSFDGCQSVKVPDTELNRRWLGKPATPSAGKARKAGKGGKGVEAAYPALWLMTLVETGTRALLGAVCGPRGKGEVAAATGLLHLLDASMLVLADRNFDAAGFMTAVAGTGAQFLIRLKSLRHPPVLARLPDGSVLSEIGGVRVRLITAAVMVTCQDGTRYGGSYRLATTLTDHRAYPAMALMRLYHERWEHEVTYLALRHTLLNGRVLRSQTPAGIEQEMWALLALYQALRIAVTDAVATAPGTDPDRASWKTAVAAARGLVSNADGITADDSDGLAGSIGAAVLDALNPPRRLRICARKVRTPLSRWKSHPAGRPRTSQTITSLTTQITTYQHDTQPRRPTSWPPLTTQPGP
jgi:Insertion element 4 transposase N-terminal/Transposase DDE domain